MTRTEIEAALDGGMVWGAMRNGRYWRLRRNGSTKLWKTRPSEFSIPVKAGMWAYAHVTHTSSVSVHGTFGWRDANFVVVDSDTNPNEAKR